MAYFENPGGRIVSEDDPKRIEELKNTRGFRMLTPDEETIQVAERVARIQELQRAPESSLKGVYLSTVSQGGKDGYGVSSAKIISELRRLNVDIVTHYTGQKIGVLFHNPYSVLRMESPYRIIYTMFESDKIPDDWKDYLEAADKVLVPSRWCQQVFKKAGIDAEVVTLGYDDRTFKFTHRPNRLANNQTFTFLHYNAFNIRKGFAEVFKAFTQEFRKDEPVKLILKTNLRSIPLPITPAQYPNIEIINETMSDTELFELHSRSDCFVFPSRGEGFGITPLEAMATGLATIVPNAHGISEYFNKEYMYEAEVVETCPGIYSRYKEQDVGKMVICSVPQLRKQMRYIYEHQDEALEKGRKASEYVKAWTFENTAKHLARIFEEIQQKEVTPKPLRNILQLEAI